MKLKPLIMNKTTSEKTVKGGIFPFIILLFLITSCASIPKEAPVLSKELGTQLQELENSHLNLVRAYFNNERKQVKKFIDETWLPAYANNFFENENIQEVWDSVVVSNDKSDRLEFIVRTVPVLQQGVNNKYHELIDPLDRLEMEVLTSIQQKYSNVKSINNTITSFLYSASEVEENRQRYLDMLGETDQKINGAIDDVEVLTTELTEKVTDADGNVEGYEDKFRKYKERINQLLLNL